MSDPELVQPLVKAMQQWQRKYFSAGISHEMWPKAVEHAFEAGWQAALAAGAGEQGMGREGLEALRALNEQATPRSWGFEAVSDAARVVVGKGRQKWILARLATKQIPEAETFANAKFIVACVRYVRAALLLGSAKAEKLG